MGILRVAAQKAFRSQGELGAVAQSFDRFDGERVGVRRKLPARKLAVIVVDKP